MGPAGSCRFESVAYAIEMKSSRTSILTRTMVVLGIADPRKQKVPGSPACDSCLMKTNPR